MHIWERLPLTICMLHSVPSWQACTVMILEAPIQWQGAPNKCTAVVYLSQAMKTGTIQRQKMVHALWQMWVLMGRLYLLKNETDSPFIINASTTHLVGKCACVLRDEGGGFIHVHHRILSWKGAQADDVVDLRQLRAAMKPYLKKLVMCTCMCVCWVCVCVCICARACTSHSIPSTCFQDYRVQPAS